MFSSKLRATTSGFTLIELLVTITIMALLIGGALAGFIRFSDNQKAFTAAKETQQLMRLAQSKAAATIYPTSTVTCDKTNSSKLLRGYRVSLSGSTFSVRAICGTSRTSVSTDGTVIKSYTTPTGVTVTGSAIDFYTLEGGTSAAPTYTFTATITGRQHRFSVLSTGVVTDVIQL